MHRWRVIGRFGAPIGRANAGGLGGAKPGAPAGGRPESQRAGGHGRFLELARAPQLQCASEELRAPPAPAGVVHSCAPFDSGRTVLSNLCAALRVCANRRAKSIGGDDVCARARVAKRWLACPWPARPLTSARAGSRARTRAQKSGRLGGGRDAQFCYTRPPACARAHPLAPLAPPGEPCVCARGPRTRWRPCVCAPANTFSTIGSAGAFVRHRMRANWRARAAPREWAGRRRPPAAVGRGCCWQQMGATVCGRGAPPRRSALQAHTRAHTHHTTHDLNHARRWCVCARANMRRPSLA